MMMVLQCFILDSQMNGTTIVISVFIFCHPYVHFCTVSEGKCFWSKYFCRVIFYFPKMPFFVHSLSFSSVCTVYQKLPSKYIIVLSTWFLGSYDVATSDNVNVCNVLYVNVGIYNFE